MTQHNSRRTGAAERQVLAQKVWQLHLQGATTDQIAHELHLNSKTVSDLIDERRTEACKNLPNGNASTDEFRERQTLLRLDLRQRMMDIDRLDAEDERERLFQAALNARASMFPGARHTLDERARIVDDETRAVKERQMRQRTRAWLVREYRQSLTDEAHTLGLPGDSREERQREQYKELLRLLDEPRIEVRENIELPEADPNVPPEWLPQAEHWDGIPYSTTDPA